jgi:thioredoxin 1
MAHAFTDQNFDQEVVKSNIPVLVDFWAPWCGPCQMMTPIVEELAQVMGDKAKIGKVNVDENPAISSQYGIMSIPSIKIFVGGKVVKEFVGVQSVDVLKNELANLYFCL